MRPNGKLSFNAPLPRSIGSKMMPHYFKKLQKTWNIASALVVRSQRTYLIRIRFLKKPLILQYVHMYDFRGRTIAAAAPVPMYKQTLRQPAAYGVRRVGLLYLYFKHNTWTLLMNTCSTESGNDLLAFLPFCNLRRRLRPVGIHSSLIFQNLTKLKSRSISLVKYTSCT